MNHIRYHRHMVTEHVTNALKRHGIDPDKHAGEIDSLIRHTTTHRLFELLERASQGEDVTTDGDERLRLILGIVLGLAEHVSVTCRSIIGVEPSPFASRTVEVLSGLLAEFRKH